MFFCTYFSAIAFAHGWKPESIDTQVVGESACYKWPYVRGYHEYKSVCSPTVGETLRLTTELTNPKDPFAVAVIRDDCVVGHIPRTVSQIVSFFLRKDGSGSFCEVTGAMVNCAAEFCLDILCIYWFYGHLAYIERLKILWL